MELFGLLMLAMAAVGLFGHGRSFATRLQLASCWGFGST
jgi:hypothetical protein